jgi:hypothetical protein
MSKKQSQVLFRRKTSGEQAVIARPELIATLHSSQGRPYFLDSLKRIQTNKEVQET